MNHSTNFKKNEDDLYNFEYYRPLIEGTVAMRWVYRLAKRVPGVIFVPPFGLQYHTFNDKLVVAYFSWMFLKIVLTIYLTVGAGLGLLRGNIEYIYLLLIPIIWFPSLEFTKKFLENPYPLFYTRWAATLAVFLVWRHFYG